jgi:hypothetical protein
VPQPASDRTDLMTRHAEAKRRRDSAALGSDEFSQAAQEVARIEVEIAAREELQTTTDQATRAAQRG